MKNAAPDPSGLYLIVFSVLWQVTFIFSPICGFLCRRHFQKLRWEGRRNFLLLHAGFMVTGAVILFTKWSFRGLFFDAFILSVAYLAYSSFVFLISILRPKVVAWLITVLGMIPTVFGLLIGFTILVFAIGDEMPRFEADLGINYSYRICWYGGAYTSHDGATLQIFYHPTLAPFLEKEVYSKTYDDSEYDFQNVSLGLSDDKRFILIRCPNSHGNNIEYFSVSANR